MIKNYLILCCIFFLSCAGPIATGPIFELHTNLDASKSLVYVYKTDVPDGTTVCMKILFNEVQSGCLNRGGFVKTILEPGEYELVVQTNAFLGPRIIEYTFKAEPGEVYYYQYLSTDSGVPENAVASKYFGSQFISGHNLLLENGEQLALSELRSLRESK